jgi:hypothetical protein
MDYDTILIERLYFEKNISEQNVSANLGHKWLTILRKLC